MSVRVYDAQRKQSERASDRDIVIPPCANPPRREAALASVYDFLSLYFGHRFYNPVTQCQREMVEAIMHRTTHGGDQAIAAPRGEGKTTIAECVTIYCLLKGLIRFPLIVAATGPDASRILENIKYEFESNDLLHADFPEVCEPIRALEGAVQRQNMQTVNGERTLLKWSHDLVVLPTVEGSKCSGAVLMTRGLDAAIRGIKYHSMRPDFVLIDDPETRESAASEYQVDTREKIIDRDIAGLAGQGKKIARVCLCTVQNRTCLAYKLTDPATKPSWHGKRYKLLEVFPTNADLWEKYVQLRMEGMTAGDREAKEATTYYLANRPAMDLGAVVSNPARFISSTWPDGTPIEYSTVQHCYNRIADIGFDSFLTEYQNDPPDEDEGSLNQLTSAVVAKRISGLAHRELPHACEKIIAAIDLGNTFCTAAEGSWHGQCIGDVLDHYTIDVHGAEKNNNGEYIQKTLDLALLKLLHDWRNRLLEKYRDANGELRKIDLALIDSGDGHHVDAVYRFCLEVGHPFYPSKGQKDHWKIPKNATSFGDRWAAVPQPAGVILVEFESTHWKRFCHERFLTPTFDDNNQRSQGSLALFVAPPDVQQFAKDRREFAHQIVGEIWGTKKIGARPGWIERGRNHGLDVTALVCLGGNIMGVGLFGQIEPRSTEKPKAVVVNPGVQRTRAW